MSVQTTYTSEIQVALAGLIADMSNTNIQSFAAVGDVAFGIFVDRDPINLEESVSFAKTDAIGVSVRASKEQGYQTPTVSPEKYSDTETVGTMRSGYIWMQMLNTSGNVGDVVNIGAGGLGDTVAGTTTTTVIVTIESSTITVVSPSGTQLIAKVKVA